MPGSTARAAYRQGNPRSTGESLRWCSLSRRSFLAAACEAGLAVAATACSSGTAGTDDAGRGSRPPAARHPLSLPGDVLIRGANLTPREAYYPRPWHNLWLEWEWDGWIKSQVDLTRTLGVNCIRTIGSVSVVAENAISLAQYRARWRQLLEYLDEASMFAYPCPSGLLDWGGGTPTEAIAVYRMLGGLFEQHRNVIGVDVSNEAQFAASHWGGADALVSVLRTLTGTLRDTTGKPLAHSVSVENTREWTQPWLARLAAISDFLDLHLYYTPAAGDVVPLLAQPWGDLPAIVGEFGIGIESSPDDRAARYLAVRDLVSSHPSFAGALAWDIASGRFGLFDPEGHPRPDISTALTAFPLHR